jgi:dienelactone hydrolase
MINKSWLRILIILLTTSIFIISGCTTQTTVMPPEDVFYTSTSAPEKTQVPADSTQAEATQTVTPTGPAEPEPTELQQSEQSTEPPAAVTLTPLPPDPQLVEFVAEDGQTHTGTYYPAGTNPAPAVVLMHWAPGDQNDWNEIAYWLQNRGLSGTSANTGGETWLDPSWFPPLKDGESYAVFTFTFRECESGCSNFLPDEWLLDAQAAMNTVKGLEGVNPSGVVTIGASIGADGAVDACGDGCLGAISLSPGSYLNIRYPEAVEELGTKQPPKPVLCFAAERDTDSFNACSTAQGDHFTNVIYPGADHGLSLINPGSDPETLGLILKFLQSILGN